MGLSLCYELQLVGSPAEARRCLTELHEAACCLSFDQVFDVIEMSPPDLDPSLHDEIDPEYERLLKIFGSQYGRKTMSDGEEVWVDIPPRHVIAFGIVPADGCEIAQIGLASHPSVVEYEHRGKTLLIETGFAGRYSWSQCCKTQYAGLRQYGGPDNFLRAHQGLVELLDRARQLGIQLEVHDDSGYWEDRDEDRLIESLGSWNGLVAALAGQMKDQLGTKRLQSPILTAPDFEHLEAQGLDEWGPERDDA